MPRGNVVCIAMMPSLWASSVEAIFDCICVVCVGETSSDGHERVHVMSVCHGRVVASVGHAPIGVDQDLVFAVQVYLNVEGLGLLNR